MQLVQAMRESPLVARAARSGQALYEVPFELKLSPEDWRLISGEASTTEEVVTGRIDLVFREADGWVIADYKTDVAAPKVLKARQTQYEKQVDIYARCWERLTGEKVKEKLVLFTAALTA
jgi:ATP-dependent helicase/nuclease subunit A